MQEPKFLQEVDRQIGSTPLSEWKTYLSWQLIHSAAAYLSAPLVEENFSFYGRYLNGSTEMKPRWKLCVEFTDASLGEALGRKYVEKYFPPAAKAKMQEMVRNLLLAMKQTVENLDWMGPETKKKALGKIATFNPKIGYPDKWKDYGSVKIRRDSFWSNVVGAAKFNVQDDLSQIGKPVDRGRWTTPFPPPTHTTTPC